MVVDARDPLFYRCPDLEAYAQEIDEQKKTLLLVNKADLLPFTVRFVLGQFLCICMHFCEPDDIDNEFSFAGRNREDMQYGAEAMLQGHMRFGRGSDMEMLQGVTSVSNVPLLTNGEMEFGYHCYEGKIKTLERQYTLFPCRKRSSDCLGYSVRGTSSETHKYQL
ncbi:uncharacterized protein LOC109840715 [Asparagus officinalis]|uniref:uncharacterized protein LOC109840715 n=1 Tax=Asparagus officinalis TaxID=4686 RepID=UPI00098E7AB4|nr:uncharacterized protein LOC109840715 [Asparagus officinalis]